MYRHLLVPLDGSRMAEAVLPIAERFGRDTGSTVTLLHVLERGAPPAVHGERHLQNVDEATDYLSGLADRLRQAGLTVDIHAHEVPEGDVARAVVDHAVEVGADLILLCTHGGGVLRQMLFGTIAQQVLKRGTIPVLLGRPTPGETRPFTVPRILVPLDGTAAAEEALEPARGLATALGAALHLVMVVATTAKAREEMQAISLALPSASRATLDLVEKEACDYLENIARRVRAAGVTTTVEVRRGDPASSLADEALEPDVGLTVVATHGRSGVQAIWAGSVIASLLSRTRGPILLLRTIEE